TTRTDSDLSPTLDLPVVVSSQPNRAAYAAGISAKQISGCVACRLLRCGQGHGVLPFPCDPPPHECRRAPRLRRLRCLRLQTCPVSFGCATEHAPWSRPPSPGY